MTIAYKLDEITETAKTIINILEKKVVLFEGNMGVGKTTLIKEIAKQLGVTENMQSPSYGLVNEYDLLGEKMYHIDLYRINNLEEALDIGIEEYLNGDFWCFIEWPKKIKKLIGNNACQITITKNKNNYRNLQIIANLN